MYLLIHSDLLQNHIEWSPLPGLILSILVTLLAMPEVMFFLIFLKTISFYSLAQFDSINISPIILSFGICIAQKAGCPVVFSQLSMLDFFFSWFPYMDDSALIFKINHAG